MARLIFRLLLVLLAGLACRGAIAELVVIVNARSGVAVMTRNEVANIFFGRNRQFFTGQEAQPVDLHDAHPSRARFYALLVGKDLADVNAYWSRQMFSGRMQPPVRVGSAEEVLKWVSTNPGGIGFVDLSKADARVRVVYELSP
jgi:ABC-type phosphate transport system substrate-binding protein